MFLLVSETAASSMEVRRVIKWQLMSMEIKLSAISLITTKTTRERARTRRRTNEGLQRYDEKISRTQGSCDSEVWRTDHDGLVRILRSADIRHDSEGNTTNNCYRYIQHQALFSLQVSSMWKVLLAVDSDWNIRPVSKHLFGHLRCHTEHCVRLTPDHRLIQLRVSLLVHYSYN
jgi:hypothetical protein